MRIISRAAAAGVAGVRVVRVRASGVRSADDDQVAVEEPLEIRIGHRPVSVTMRTPGDDPELAAGFLLTEGLLRGASEIASITPSGNIINLDLNSAPDVSRLQRNFYASSSCGVCGKASIESIRALGCAPFDPGVPRLDAAVLGRLPLLLRRSQAAFEETGGLHAAALFSVSGDLLYLKEDVGRHNAVDKVAGARFLAGDAAGDILLVSGRAGFELVQKAAMARIPVLAAIGAPSSLAIELAESLGMTLVGFLRADRLNVYAGEARLLGKRLPVRLREE